MGFGLSFKAWLRQFFSAHCNVCGRKNYRLQDIQLSKNRSLAAKLVENTGLEPVTSWLQTRRSPS